MSTEVRLKCSPCEVIPASNGTAIEMYCVEMYCNCASQTLKEKTNVQESSSEK